MRLTRRGNDLCESLQFFRNLFREFRRTTVEGRIIVEIHENYGAVTCVHIFNVITLGNMAADESEALSKRVASVLETHLERDKVSS